MKAFETIGINSREQESILRVLSAILHLGNIQFGFIFFFPSRIFF